MSQQIDASKLNESDRQELTQFIATEAQKSNIQSTVHELTDTCWKKCVTGKISAGGLDRSEESCAQNCVERWMDANLAVFKHLETLRGSQ